MGSACGPPSTGNTTIELYPRISEETFMHTRFVVLLAGLVLAMPAAGWAEQPCGGDYHCGGCAPAPCQTCQSVPDVIKHTKPVYTCKCADICYPKRSLCDLLRG